MRRLVPFSAAALCMALVLPVRAQHRAASHTPGSAVEAAQARPDALPVAPLPFTRPSLHLLGDAAAADRGTQPLGEADVLNRIGRIYGYQARILAAQAQDDADATEELLARAMAELGTLVQQPAVMERPRFRELYRTMVTEYERFHGVSPDSLGLQYGDIFQFRTDMFAMLNDVDEPLLEDVLRADLQPVETVFPMTMNRLVDQSIRYLLRSPDKHLYHWLGRAETYFPMIERIMAEEGVPDELKYLAMIESGLNPRARSWAAAGGMWQFISATGRAYGLEVNGWVDERLDPEKATRAAARHLRDLHRMFGGDWQLALAGYNCSPSRIKRAIRRFEARSGRNATFWDIYDDIPRETRNYVPMFIAASLVASNPEAFDVDLSRVEPGPRYAYHYVPVRGMLTLDDVADMAGTRSDVIRALNPELRRSMLPPSRDGYYYVRIPEGTYDRFAAAYDRLPEEKKRVTAVEHVVRRGDVLGRIAGKYGVSVRDLMRTNGLRSTVIRVGQRLVVPVPSYENDDMQLAGLDEAQALTVDYGERAVRPISVAAAPKPAPRQATRPATPVVRTSTAAASDARPEPRAAEAKAEKTSAETRIVYQVRRGDTLGEIARKYGVSVGDLRRWNGISGSRIQVGQRLNLYDTGEAAEQQRTVYRVRRGDTLGEIARSYGVSVNDLRQWNSIRGSRIQVGQRLTIYGSSGPKVVRYRVQRGDTLIEIARKYGVSVNDLRRWNGIRGSRIRIGQRLTIHS